MAGYVLTDNALASMRSLVRGVLGHVITHDDDIALAQEAARHLRGADGLDSERLREVAEWAREQAKTMAESARIVEVCDGILLALAEPRLPEAVGDEPLHVVANRPCDATMPEPAANTPNLAGLPSADRVVLGQIMATLRGEPVTANPHAGAAVDVLVELGVYLGKLATALDVDRTTSAPALLAAARECAAPYGHEHHSLPDTHPLRRYRWGAWLDALLRREEAPAGSGCWEPDPKRVEALRQARERAAMLDADGLSGMCVRLAREAARRGTDVLTSDELVLLRYAADSTTNTRIVGGNGDALRLGCHVVPPVEQGGGK